VLISEPSWMSEGEYISIPNDGKRMKADLVTEIYNLTGSLCKILKLLFVELKCFFNSEFYFCVFFFNVSFSTVEYFGT
jgi:hypothetical protein